MIRYEFRVISFDVNNWGSKPKDEALTQLQQAGSEGWDIASAVTVSGFTSHLVLKRPIGERTRG